MSFTDEGVPSVRQLASHPGLIEAVEARRMLAAHVAGNSATFATIQAAVDAAPAGGTVTVDPGTYQELVVIQTPGLTLKGARAGVDARTSDRGGESVVRGTDLGGGIRSSSFLIDASDVTLDGFVVEDQTSVGRDGAGIVIAPDRHGTQILNNVVQHNVVGLALSNDSASDAAIIRHNLFLENNQPQPGTGRGIYSDGGVSGGRLTNVTIDENVFLRNFGGLPDASREAAIDLHAGAASSQTDFRITNNVFDGNGKALLAFNASGITIQGNVVVGTLDTRSAALRFEGNVHDVGILNNTIYDNISRGIRIDNNAASGSNYDFDIINNNIYGNADSTGQGVNRDGIFVNAGTFDGTLNARNNWWGSASGPSGDGPGSGDAVYANGNSVAFSPWATAPIGTLQVPYYGKPLSSSSSRVDFASFDHGGEGVGYHDADKPNRGTYLHTTEGVDVQRSADTSGSGYDVGFTAAGEWLEYTLDIQSSGTYNIDFRVANAQQAGGKFHLEVDGANVTGPITVPNTGGWQVWQTVTKTGVNLPAGPHVVRVVFDSEGSGGAVGNFNWFRLSKTSSTQPPPPPPAAPAAPSGLAASAASSSSIKLAWTDQSNNESGFKLERSTDGANFAPIATPGANATTFTDTGLSPSNKYFYRIRATNSGGDSGYSNVASATTAGVVVGNQNVTYIATGATWKYLDNGSNQGAAWRATGFNDSSWKSGAAQLGYGDGDEKTVVNYGPDPDDKFVTTYFRKTFNVADASKVKALALRLLRDDGAVVYINGQEVFRDNMPGGTVSFDTYASDAIEDPSFHNAGVSPSALHTGTNTIAVEIHQATPYSSDISFDLDLKATVGE